MADSVRALSRHGCPCCPACDANLLLVAKCDLSAVRRFTNITRDFKGTLDYILYTADSLAPGGLLELPEEAEVKPRPSAGLPNDTWSSDHIALMATFHYRQGGGGGS